MQFEDLIASAELREKIDLSVLLSGNELVPSAVKWEIIKFTGFDKKGITEDRMHDVALWRDKNLWAEMLMVNKVWVHYLDNVLRLPGRSADAFDFIPTELPDPAKEAVGAFWNTVQDRVDEVIVSPVSFLSKNWLWVLPVGLALYLAIPVMTKSIIKKG